MKVRIKFAKTGALRYIGHLDVMRYFQKAIRRTEIEASYSNGFSPHMIMSFAEPLGVGLTSIGEYFDLELNYEEASCPSGEHIIKELNAQMAEGIKVLSVRKIESGRKSNAMSLVAAASYTVSYALSSDSDREKDQDLLLKEFLSLETVPAEKKTKSGTKTEDIRPLIYKMETAGVPAEEAEEGFERAIHLFCSAGSAANLKPETAFGAFFSFAGLNVSRWEMRIRRDEMYAAADGGTFVPLERLGEPF